jgi:feruloyl esterase
METMITRYAFGLIMLAGFLHGQNAPHIREWKPPKGESPSGPQKSCSALRTLTGYEFTIVTADLQPAKEGAPEFCRVIGQILPEIRFEVSLPTAWNKRLFMFGNGGFAGENLESPNRIAVRDQAIKSGFTVAQTNTGHDAQEEPLGTFAVNSQKLLDYAFRGVHVTAVTAKKLAAAYYGSAPMKSYFVGCSNGGRQALMSAQRFPEDFDGIVVGAPALDFTGTMTSFVQTAQALARAPLPTTKLGRLADQIYTLCDGKDGATDGLIDDPRRCGFKPSRDLARCAEGVDSPDCFTAAQIQTLETMYGDITSKGKRVFPGWPVGAEVAGSNGRSGWDVWIVRDGGPTQSAIFAETFFRYVAYPKKDPNYELKEFDLDRDLPRMKWISDVLNATETDLSAFRDRGGKLLMWYGWADQALNPLMGIEYYEEVSRKMGPKTQEFFRLYMIPGLFHCAGGPGCGSFDILGPIVSWVEQGKAPVSLPAAQIEAGKTVRTRPLCPYPQVAKYKGSGNIDDATNFSCANPY